VRAQPVAVVRKDAYKALCFPKSIKGKKRRASRGQVEISPVLAEGELVGVMSGCARCD
jgi:hypothetical protein